MKTEKKLVFDFNFSEEMIAIEQMSLLNSIRVTKLLKWIRGV